VSQVGERATFAIEWEVTQRKEQQILGNFCFWAAGMRVGDFSELISLSYSVNRATKFISHEEYRYVEFLNGKSKEEVLSYIYDTAVVTIRPAETVADAIQRADKGPFANLSNDYNLHSTLMRLFHLNSIGQEAFDEISIILFNDTVLSIERLIWRKTSIWQVFEQDLPFHQFEHVISMFLQCLQYLLSDNNI
jgi:hypothetical protein